MTEVYSEPVESTPTRVRRPPFILIGSIVLLVLCGVVAFVAFNVFKGTRNSPIAFEQYPDSQLVREASTATSDTKLFVTNASIQDVFNFYAQRLPKDETNGCEKLYIDAKPSEEPGHWYGKCVIDNSLLDISQRLTITINYQSLDGSNEMRTYYAVDRQWGRE